MKSDKRRNIVGDLKSLKARGEAREAPGNKSLATDAWGGACWKVSWRS